MTEVVYKPWQEDSQHSVYDTANARRVELFEDEIEGLQVKVKRTSEGKFIVKTRIPIPPKPVAKKKAATKKSTKTSSSNTKTPAKKTVTTPKVTAKPAASTKKRAPKKTSRKRK